MVTQILVGENKNSIEENSISCSTPRSPNKTNHSSEVLTSSSTKKSKKKAYKGAEKNGLTKLEVFIRVSSSG